MSFKSDISRFNLKVAKGSTRFFRKVGIAAYQNITNLTPVDEGRAKANWYPATNFVDQSASKNVSFDSGRADSQFTNVDPGDTMNISNSLPYIKKLELGSSLQAPQGMVRLTAIKIKKDIESGRFND